MASPLGGVQSEIIVYRLAEFLLAAEVTLSRLNRCVPQKKLNLLKLSTRQVA